MKWRYEFASPSEVDQKHIMVLYPKQVEDGDELRVRMFSEMTAPRAAAVLAAVQKADGEVEQLPLRQLGNGRWALLEEQKTDSRPVVCIIVSYAKQLAAIDMHSTVHVAPFLSEAALATGVDLWVPPEPSFSTDATQFNFGRCSVNNMSYTSLTPRDIVAMFHPRLHTNKIKLKAFGHAAARAMVTLSNGEMAVLTDGEATITLTKPICVCRLSLMTMCNVACEMQATADCVFLM